MRLPAIRLFVIGLIAPALSCGSMTGPSTSPSLEAIVPASGPIGTTVTLTGTAFAATGNLVLFAPTSLPDVVVPAQIPSADGHTITFTVPGVVRPPCQVVPAPEQPCPQYVLGISPGMSVQVAVQTPQGTSNSLTFSVTS